MSFTNANKQASKAGRQAAGRQAGSRQAGKQAASTHLFMKT